MKKLLEGIVHFKKNDFENHKELFNEIGSKQKPHTLFIGCSDSRVVPNMITRTLPGELFIIRNIANIVPHYRKTEEYVSTTSAIEYAVEVLNVENIVVCGHSNCGGCASLFLPEEKLAHLPHTKKWLELSKGVKEKVLEQVGENDLSAREWLAEQINVLEQLKHLLTYPFIEKRFNENRINIEGWHYIIETGEIFAYDAETGYFNLIN